MQDAGWDVTIGPEGAVETFIPEGQEDAYDRQAEECWGGAASVQFSDLSTDEREATYDRQLQVRNCLIGEGAAMPPAPSFQSYVDMGGVWSPYVDLLEAEAPVEEFVRFEAACPQVESLR